MTWQQALRRQKPLIFCPRCGWWSRFRIPGAHVDAVLNGSGTVDVPCPQCRQPGIDALYQPEPAAA